MLSFSSYQSSLAALCSRYGVVRLEAFGSVLTKEFSRASDIDMVVTFSERVVNDHASYAATYFGLHDGLEALFGRRVDLLEEQALTNPYLRSSINQHKQSLFVAETYQY